MVFPDFRVNAVAVMSNQPSSIQHIPASPTFVRLAGGGYTAALRSGGARVVVRWGVNAALDGAFDELLADLAGNTAARLRWEDPNGNTFDLDVLAEAVGSAFGPGQWYDAFTVTFWEQAS